jgi:hypothetical protein
VDGVRQRSDAECLGCLTGLQVEAFTRSSNMNRRHALLFVVLSVPSMAGLRASPAGARHHALAAPCMTDTIVRKYILSSVRFVLDTEPPNSNRRLRASAGLSGVSFSQATVIEDSATCERARIAYTGMVYPGVADSTSKRNFTEDLEEVMVVRLTANRFVLATDIINPIAPFKTDMLSPISMFEMFVVDSTYALVKQVP